MTISGTQTPAAGQSIPTPPDFPVHWDDPGDAKLIVSSVARSKNRCRFWSTRLSAPFW